MKFLDASGLTYLWKKLSLQDYPNNETLVSVINAIDETKADKSSTPSLDLSTGKVLASQVPIITNTYSTDEQVSGTWIDGRTIYKRTLVYSENNLSAKKYWAYLQFNADTGLADLKITQYIKVEGMALCYSEIYDIEPTWQPIPRICPDATETYSIGFGDFDTSQIGVLFGTKYTSATIYLTIEYLKN